jgi:hypothetical protein
MPNLNFPLPSREVTEKWKHPTPKISLPTIPPEQFPRATAIAARSNHHYKGLGSPWEWLPKQ